MKKSQKDTDAIKKDKKVSVICYLIAFIVAFMMLWPQIIDIVGHIQDLANVGAMRDQIDQAGSEADEWIGKLETIGGNNAAEDAINDAGNSAENIGDIIDGLKGQ